VTISTSSAATPPHHDLVVVTPCYDDWGALPRLLDALENAIAALGLDGHVLVVNDGGSMLPDALAEQLAQETGLRCEIIDLSTNLGHQRAIAIGLAYAEANLSADHLLVMDADGEDNPAALADLLAVARKTPRAIVFAERTARSEGPLFRAGYALFKRLFRALSGQAITFGNFSLVPWSMLRSLVVSSELWVHYAAGVIRARLPFVTVPVARAPRYAGESQMSLAGLILHGMSAISLFTDVAAVRVLLFALGVLLFSGLGIAVATALKLFTPLATPGWATSVVVGLTILMMQVITLALVLMFVSFQQRATSGGALPAEIHARFIARVTTLRAGNLGLGAAPKGPSPDL
jgi:hypothetical protein